MRKCLAVLVTVAAVIGLFNIGSASAATCDQNAWNGVAGHPGAFLGNIDINHGVPYASCPASETSGKWTTLNESPTVPVYRLEPWGYFRGLCVLVGTWWQAFTRGNPIPPSIDAVYEWRVNVRAEDAAGNCTVVVNVPHIRTSVFARYQEFGATRSINDAGPVQNICSAPTTGNTDHAGIVIQMGSQCVPFRDFSTDFSRGWYHSSVEWTVCHLETAPCVTRTLTTWASQLF